MVRTIIILFVLLALGAGIILLQIYLSKKENKWLGLVLPIISFCISLITVFSNAVYTTNTRSVLTVTDENGVVIQEEVIPETPNTTQLSDKPLLIFTFGIVLLIYNIPTIVLLLIYFSCREKQRQRKALTKMQAQDLE